MILKSVTTIEGRTDMSMANTRPMKRRQRAVDLWDATQAIKDDVARITPLRVA
jgi:hypothetical protein